MITNCNIFINKFNDVLFIYMIIIVTIQMLHPHVAHRLTGKLTDAK